MTPYEGSIKWHRNKIKRLKSQHAEIEWQIKDAEKTLRSAENKSARETMKAMLPDWSKISLPSHTSRCPPYDSGPDTCFVCDKDFTGHRVIHSAYPCGPGYGLLSDFNGRCLVHDGCLPSKVHAHVHDGLL